MKDKIIETFPVPFQNVGDGLVLVDAKQVLEAFEQKHTHNPSKVSGICEDCGYQLMPEEVNL